MKRVFAALLVLMMLLGIAACGEAQEPADSPEKEETPVATSQQTPDTTEIEDTPYDGKTYSFINDTHHAYKAVALSAVYFHPAYLTYMQSTS